MWQKLPYSKIGLIVLLGNLINLSHLQAPAMAQNARQQLMTTSNANISSLDLSQSKSMPAQRSNNSDGQLQELFNQGFQLLKAARETSQQKRDDAEAIRLTKQAVMVFQQGLEIAQKNSDRVWIIKMTRGIADAQNATAVYLNRAGGYTQALREAEKALQTAQQALMLTQKLNSSGHPQPDNDQEIAHEWQGVFLVRYNLVGIYRNLKKLDSALEQIQQLQQIVTKTKNPQNERYLDQAEQRIYIGLVSNSDQPEKYDEYLEINQRLIVISRKLMDRESESMALVHIARVYAYRNDYKRALETYTQALILLNQSTDITWKIVSLQAIGNIYGAQADYQQALDFYQKALKLSQDNNQALSGSTSLNNIATIYQYRGNFDKALSIYRKELADNERYYIQFSKGATLENIQAICRESPGLKEECQNMTQAPTGAMLDGFKKVIAGAVWASRKRMADILSNIASVEQSRGNYPKALELNEESLSIIREMGDRDSEALGIHGVAMIYLDQGDYSKARKLIQQAVQLAQTRNDPAQISTTRSALAKISRDQGDYQTALTIYQELLKWSQTVRRRSDTAVAYARLASVYHAQGEYSLALQNNQQAISIRKSIGNLSGVAETQVSLGNLYRDLGDPTFAIQQHRAALVIAKKIGSQPQEIEALLALASAYQFQGNIDEALGSYNQAWEISQRIGNLQTQSIALSGLGAIYIRQQKSTQALETLNQSLKIQQEIGLQPQVAVTLRLLGEAGMRAGDYKTAQIKLEQAISLAQKMGDRPTIAPSLSHLANLYAQQNQPELAISFYKKSVNTYEEIRTSNKQLTPEQQASYTQTVRSTYENLAALLFQRGRIAEALQVLDLLKVQDLQDFLKGTQGKADSTQKLQLLEAETAILQDFEQQKTQSLDQWLTNPNLKRHIQTIQATAIAQGLQSPGYQSLQTRLNQLSQNAALFYPLVLTDHLELVILLPGKAPIRRTVNVTKAELENHIKTFRQQIGDANTNGIPKHDINTVKQSANKLYNWLIQPIAAELQAANIQTILYAPDGQLRYIPLAALYDGNQWLTQKYQINHLTALALTPIDPASSQPPRTLAAAFTQGTYPFTIPISPSDSNARSGNTTESISFTGLKHGRGEIDSLSQILKIKPDTLFDKDFSKAAIVDRLPNYNILHLATHGIFIPDKPEESFIVMGHGERLRLTDIKGWNFPNLQFVMLSACETGQGQQLSNGIEVLGFGYQLQQAKVRASMTSLWKVHDAGTRLLSQQFYQQAYSNNLRKTAALQKVQQDFIAGKMDVEMAKLRGACFGYNCDDFSTLPAPITVDATHPYYWAPFIIVGNGL